MTKPDSGFWKDKKVLVTGGASFIGSHLTEYLVKLGAKVKVADDLSSGTRENLKDIINSIEFVETDLRDIKNALTATEGREIVFHLAAKHGGRGYIDTHPADCANNMVLDGMVIEAAHQSGVSRYCFTSSACVYPTDLQVEATKDNLVYLKEEYADPFVKGSAYSDGEYGWAKLMGELGLKAYVKQYGIKGVSCRLFTAYGERENETHAVIAFIAKAFGEMDPYEIWGNGEQDRNFTYVGDIVEGMIMACEKITDGRAVNIGTAEHIKINDAVEEVFQITGFRPKEIFHDMSKPVGVFSRAADLTRIRENLDWEPHISFHDGLERTIDWYYKNRDKDYVVKNLQKILMER